jgi:hypothetical protein
MAETKRGSILDTPLDAAAEAEADADESNLHRVHPGAV